MKFSKIYVLLVVTVAIAACSPSDNSTTNQAEAKAAPAPEPALVADTVYTNGRIYTVNKAMPWAEAVAARD